ncbi:hypothetical protein [Paramicrobacterium chengjingii]|uniref:SDR-like Ig domain-containing protein n=1 Tax=Paramicrobacterium chengjingii TaxID=2769067 RepID=A0ABX6YJP1_9MICO|nr:hypothetical protein [Microbacterium chengjingii]QPZ38845.1 hypothetical protein HCR76_01690 [Microbacterium chengjingii]
MSIEPQTDRRTLMKVGAWSVPVIAVAAATPAAAASTTPPVIITADLLVLQDFSAKLVVCGGEQYVDTAITITTSDGRQIPEGSTLTLKFDLPENPSESETEFGGVIVGHAEDTVPTGGNKVNKMIAIFSWIEDIFGFASVTDAAPQQVTKSWEVDIEEADPETYEISNVEYDWVQADGSWYLSGSLDLGQPQCGPGMNSDSISVEVANSFASWFETTGDGNESLHLTFQDEFGKSDPGNGEYLTFTIGEWSERLPFYYPAP